MKRSKVLGLYATTLLCLLLYSYALVDPNITYFNSPVWTNFRNIMVQLGYFHRNISTTIFVLVISSLMYFHLLLVKEHKGSPVKLALLISGLLLFSYPFLSHDLFNYMFDARILTVHHANPYIHAALDFPEDQWLRFMHWTHRPYPYGPSFLPITLIPSLLSAGKFLLNMIFFKGMYALMYLWTVYMLSKIKRSYGIFFATQPLVIIEGLVNNHNDLIAVMFAIMGIYFLSNKFLANISYALSAGIKFITVPMFVLQSKKSSPAAIMLSVVGMISLIIYLSFKGEFQQWYVLNFFAYTPFIFPYLKKIHIFSYGVLLSYYPFVLFGEWNTEQNTSIKHIVIVSALILNVGYMYHRKKELLN